MADDSKDSKEPKLTESLKKVFAAGVSAAFMTEESLRAYLGEMKLPKEILATLLQGAAKTKDEIATRVTNEMVSMINKIDFLKEFSKFAEDHKFKITAEVEILKKKKDKTHSEE
ncbi:MAG: hypothetical protein BroJett040_21150 [Oligoflexia bacterium]|nr:MAG: hypothetical protein BroJett040_21150 [Oligoflexia bacterium]